MTDIDLDAIQARVDAATKGPWLVKGMYPQEVLANDDGLTLVATTHSSPDGPPSNTEFIAHARTDVAALITAVRERDATIARVLEVLETDHLPRPVNDWDRGWDRAIAEVRAAMDQQELT